MKTRILSGIVIVIVALVSFILGGPVLCALSLVMSLIGLYEFYKAVKVLPEGKIIDPISSIGYAGCIAVYAIEYFLPGENHWLLFVMLLVILAMLAVYVLTYPKYESNHAVYASFGFCYMPVLFSFIFQTRNLENGIYLVWLIFIASSVCDTFAYFTGMAFGKHRLAPVLSPKKSIEGAIGGTVFAAVIGGVYGYCVKGYLNTNRNVVFAFVVICVVGAVVSQIGDLAASAFKRNFEIKDYGKIIPGHGGIMDRVDSMLFAGPMVYIIFYLFFMIK